MKVIKKVYVPLAERSQGPYPYTPSPRGVLASELADTLNRLVPTLPPDAFVEPILAPQHPGMMGGQSLVLAWYEELPDQQPGA